MQKVDLVYVLGSGSIWNNNELRFSLRSVQKNLKGVGKVYILGEDDRLKRITGNSENTGTNTSPELTKQYPKVMRRLKYEYSDLFNKRSLLHKRMRSVPAENSQQNINSRAVLLRDIRAITDQKYELIKAHIIDPENSPLPEHLHEQLDRLVSMSKVMDKNPVIKHAVALHRSKFLSLSETTAYRDARVARKLYNSLHEFDFDFWQPWLINDIVENINRLNENPSPQNRRIIAMEHASLLKAIGEKPEEATHFGDAADKGIWTKYGNILYNKSSTFVSLRL